ncbi:DEAD/DEAH box helicase family protein [Bosea sp. 47.2.35]|uniref:DEAD/DEAH box helicase family protein n=1 Tax=Bosea sp. 47.2.35 TaxID=2969304 RepID=UPI00214FEB79|nr:DEAD/DEAH box helicase family protein [Bosea sp. 47.2.35]MCR4524128.1 DEAD/DEAH box helicase family protein [Bosea sp. 47.2.35]
MFEDHTDIQSEEINNCDVPIDRGTIILHDAPAGSGKTRSLCQIAAKMANKGEAIIFVQPTKELISKTIEKFPKLENGAEIRRIDSDVIKSTVASIMKYLRESDAEGKILFITRASFERIPYFFQASRWHLFIDEVLQPHRMEALKFPETHRNLTDHLKTSPRDHIWSELLIADPAGASELRKNAKTDAGLEPFAKSLNLLTSPHWDTYVHSEHYSNLLNGLADGKSEAMLFAKLKPSICAGFKSVRMAGAHIADSNLVSLWSKEGVKFRYETLPELQYSFHPNCERIKIYYGFDRNWSKYIRDEFENELLEPLIEKSVEMANGNEFLFLANLDQEFIFNNSPNAIRLPNSPHGLNDYMGKNMVVFLSALNPTPQYRAFLNFLGLNYEEIRRDFYYNVAYQAVLRGGIRRADGTEDQIIVVPDRGLAEWLQAIFHGSSIEWLGIELPDEAKRKVGRPRIHSSNSEKMKAYRDRMSSVSYHGLYEHLISWIEENQSEEGENCHNSCDETPYISNKDKVTRFYATIWENTYSKFPKHYIFADDHAIFIEKLKEYSKIKYAKKEDNCVLTLGLPAPNSESMRKHNNFVLANGLILDNDGGGISPEAFASIMSGFEIYIFNTFSSTPDNPRWRAYIPTQTVMPPDCYREIISRIFDSLKSHGFEKHGFDNKKWPSDMMYLPCQAAHPDGSFFLEFRGPERGLLDPRSWISFEDVPENLHELVEKAASERTYRPSVEEDFEEDIQRWRTEGNVPHKRDAGWSALYFALVNKRFRFERIREIMTDEAHLISRARERNKLLSQLDRLLIKKRR